MTERISVRSARARARWVAIGAALAMSLGAGGFHMATATGAPNADASVFVPIVPCRAIDTRVPTGPITAQLTAASTSTVTMTGSIGQCTDIPLESTALSVNLTTVRATQDSFLTVWPANETRPTASHINPRANSSVTANGIDVRLSPDGAVSIYNDAGSLHLVVDILGAYVPGDGAPGPRGPQGDPGAAGPAGPPGPAGTASIGRQFGYDIVYSSINATGVAGGPGGDEMATAIGVDGNPIVAFDPIGDGIGITHCEDIVCEAATTTVYTDLFNAGDDLSLTIGADGLAIISHLQEDAQDLMVTHCDDIACTTATHTIFDTVNDDGWATSITIGTDGLPIISSYDFDDGDLVVTHCDDVACTTATHTTHSTPDEDGLLTSITIGTDGLPIISHRNLTAEDLVMTHCDDVACTTATHTTYSTPGNDGLGTSIAIGIDGLPIVSHRDDTTKDLVMTHCDDVACTTATRSAYSMNGANGLVADGLGTSIAIGIDGLPLAVISHFFNTFDLLKDVTLTRCSNVTCTSAETTRYPTDALDGLDASVTIGSDGNPIVAHVDSDTNSLVMTHLSKSAWTANGWD